MINSLIKLWSNLWNAVRKSLHSNSGEQSLHSHVQNIVGRLGMVQLKIWKINPRNNLIKKCNSFVATLF